MNESQARAVEKLTSSLKALHVRAGEPSNRNIASGIGGMSHTTVGNALRGERIPTWPVLSKVVEYLGGDQDDFRDLWTATRESGARTTMAATAAQSTDGDVSVFVSYARVDDKATYGRIGDFVESVKISYESMTGQQVRVFRDTDSIEGGQLWLDQIRSGIASSAVLLAFVSPAYLRSQGCIQEYREFESFIVSSDSSIRIIVPLLFADSDRIDRYFAADTLWKDIQAIQRTELAMLRQEAVGSPVWIAKTQEVVDRIEEILLRADSPTEAGISPAGSGGQASGGDEPRPTQFLNVIAQAEESAPETLLHIENLATLLQLTGEKAEAATPPMLRATTAKKKLMHTRRLARELTPVSRRMFEEAEGLKSGMGDWDNAVRAITERVEIDPAQLNDPDVVTTLDSLEEMAHIGVENLYSLEEFRTVLRGTRGLSRELDVPLQVMEDAMRVIAEVSGTLSGWSETIGVARSVASDSDAV